MLQKERKLQRRGIVGRDKSALAKERRRCHTGRRDDDGGKECGVVHRVAMKEENEMSTRNKSKEPKQSQKGNESMMNASKS